MKNNVIWILVDGIRNYHSVGDELARLPVMDRLAEKGIYFSNAVTSATSTAMSISAQHVGIPSAFLSRNFQDFKYDSENFTTLSSVLKQNGYNNYGMSFAIDLRYIFSGIIDHVPKSYWPRGYNNGVAWDNPGLMKLFNNVINQGLSEPFFLFIHINGREWAQKTTSVNEDVEEILLRLNTYLDNSILIMNSDHGMPDPKKSKKTESTKRHGKLFDRHDLLMTDDNILVPLNLNYPGCKKEIINTVVGSIDIMPTVLELLDIDFNYNSLVGKSLVPLIKNKNLTTYSNRIIRTDTRYLTQEQRMISLRSNNYKYVYYKDVLVDDSEFFFDLSKDKQELNNLISTQDNYYKEAIEIFRKEYELQELELINFQKKYLSRKLEKFLERKNISGSLINIIIIGSDNADFNNLILDVFRECFHSSVVTLNSENIKFTNKGNNDAILFIVISDSSFEQYRSANRMQQESEVSSNYLIDSNFDLITSSIVLKILKDYYNYFIMIKDIYLMNPHRLIRRVRNIIGI